MHGQQGPRHQRLAILCNPAAIPPSERYDHRYLPALLAKQPLGKHVVFGRVVRGYEEVIRKIADVPVDEKSRPAVPVTIDSCGELVLRAKVQEPKGTGTEILKYGMD